MISSASWRSGLLPRPADRRLASWLTEPDSLTARCQRGCRHFFVRVLDQGQGRYFADEMPSLGRNPGKIAWVREVVLECDGVPVIYAHTVMARRPRGRLTRWLAGLGSRSLGSLLFTHPGFVRDPLEFQRLDSRHPLLRQAIRRRLAAPGKSLWARRSAHRLAGQTVLVTEIFLPAILELSE